MEMRQEEESQPEGPKPKREQHRLGWGEYDWPDWRLSRAIGRTYFLHAVQDVEPRVLADLAAVPLRLYQVSGLRRSYGAYFDLRDYLNGDPEPGYSVPKELFPLVEALQAWGTRWWLSAPWCLTRGLETLGLWTSVPDSRQQAWSLEGVQFSGPVDATEIELSFSDRGWNPVVMSWDDYEEQLLATVRNVLQDYRRHIEGLVQSRGLVPTREKREAEAHFMWLARYQLKGDKTNRIAKDAGRTWKAVNIAIRDCADFIALPLRPSASRGRPETPIPAHLRQNLS